MRSIHYFRSQYHSLISKICHLVIPDTYYYYVILTKKKKNHNWPNQLNGCISSSKEGTQTGYTSAAAPVGRGRKWNQTDDITWLVPSVMSADSVQRSLKMFAATAPRRTEAETGGDKHNSWWHLIISVNLRVTGGWSESQSYEGIHLDTCRDKGCGMNMNGVV